MNWSNIPNDIIYQKILPLLPIDTKLSLKIKPQKIPDDIITNLQNELNKIENRPFIYHLNCSLSNIRFIDIRKIIANKTYVYWKFFVGENDEYVYTQSEQDITNETVSNSYQFNFTTMQWEIQVFPDREFP
jgi:hypothetical protein